MRRGSIPVLLCALVLLAGCRSQPPTQAETDTPPPPNRTATLEEQSLDDLFNGLDEPPEEFCLSSFALCDITGDGQKELALYTDDFAGWNYVSTGKTTWFTASICPSKHGWRNCW